MNYQVRVYDTWNRRIAVHDHVPLLKATRRAPNLADTVQGILPGRVEDLGHGYRIEVVLDGEVFLSAFVNSVNPQWSDTRKLILERFVRFHEVISFEAAFEKDDLNTKVVRSYTNRTVGQIVRDAIQRAPGEIHYLVDHGAYPDGAAREYQKFLSRKTAENELEIGGIAQGQWVDGARIDLTGASAKDGDTIQGLKVDGVEWPDFRLMLVDSEETFINSHGKKVHPEIAGWSAEQYAASGYKLKADAATAFLQDLLDTEGIDFIELNPHRDGTGAFDDRVDVFGRYLGLVYGGGECFNAGLVEEGHAEVFLFDDGRFLVPELELKDFFSYTGPNQDSIENSTATLTAYDVNNDVFEVLTAMSYVADGYVWSLGLDGAISFRRASRADRVVFFDSVEHAVELGSTLEGVANAIFFEGNPLTSGLDKGYFNDPSIDEYGFRWRSLDYFSISLEPDADRLVSGLLKDVAYPMPSGSVEFFSGDGSIAVGQILEFRDGDLRRLEREIPGEWDDRFTGRMVGRVSEVTHSILGDRVQTVARLTSPFRTVENPVSFIVGSQLPASSLFQFRLEEATVGLDLGFHLD